MRYSGTQMLCRVMAEGENEDVVRDVVDMVADAISRTSRLRGSSLEIARQVLQIEIEAIEAVLSRLDESFDRCVDVLYALRGRIIVTGVGKSGIIGRKIAATLTSTGSPAIFVHPVEGLHGDLGIVSRDDALVALSNSGESTEITSLAATIRKRGPVIIAMTGSSASTLAGWRIMSWIAGLLERRVL